MSDVISIDNTEEDNNHCDNCDYLKKIETNILLLSSNAFKKITILNSINEEYEWNAWLIGKDNVIEDIYIMEQEVSESIVTVSDEALVKVENVIGMIHSHNTMYGTEWSGKDEETMKNYNYSLLTWNNNKIIGKKLITLPCGLITTKEVVVKVEQEEDIKKLVLEFKEKVKVVKNNINNYISNYNNYDYNNYDYNNYDSTDYLDLEINTCNLCFRKIKKSKIKYCSYCNKIYHKKCFKKHDCRGK